MKPKIERKFMLYDGLACGGVGSDEANVLCVASSLEEAREDSKMFGEGAIYYEDIDFSTIPGRSISKEVWVEDF